ncbi:hypothetical protein FO519_007674 [Halicephalobus sp. NKZ332]|nr:hypothetical protein FO519_007674 [Halicephalobus sp. NKZ332]
MFPKNRLTQLRQPTINSYRLFSAQQAAAALRPFYFAVHPDRFAKDPAVRSKNEKALQIFNGYLNDLFPNRGHPKPVNVVFSVMRNNKLEDVSINLSGEDPHKIVETALKKLDLSTKDLPKPKSRLYGFYESTTPQTSSMSSSLDDLWRTLHEKDIKIRKKSKAVYIKPNDLFSQLVKNRDLAVKKYEANLKTKELLQEDIDHIKRKTGVLEIIWAIEWDQSYMRRCLSNVDLMISQSSKDERIRILRAMRGYPLIFGRGSYVCCDSSLQFGADDVPEKWQKVCLEAAVRRLEVKNFEKLYSYTKELFGNEIELFTEPQENLLKAIGQLQSIIGKISTKSKGEIMEMQRYAKNHKIEIVSVYGELAATRDGRLQVPSNVDFAALVEFLKLNENRNSDVRNLADGHQEESILEIAEETRRSLELLDLTWDSGFPEKEIEDTLKKLKKVDESVKNMIRGLWIHISTNPSIFVMNDGKVSIPTDFY